MTEWREQLRALDVDNLFVYVGDAVRSDYAPEPLLDSGLVFETAAASIHSPPSFASLSTGCHPPTHGVYGFDNRVTDGILTLFDLDVEETRFVNSVRDNPEGTDPIFSVLDIDPTNVDGPLDSLDRPFAVMERGPGGHAPYGDFEGTAWEYFRTRGDAPARRFQEEYEAAVKADFALFERRLSTLAERDLLESTLVVYTSDHGELLGEGGMLGHNGPMRPELIEVPTVFVHPSLPSIHVDDRYFRHVDLLPTLLMALNSENGHETEGVPATQEPSMPALSFYRSEFPTGRLPGLSGELHYEGVWADTGGHVYARSSMIDRLAVFAGKLLRSASREYLRSNWRDASLSYAQAGQTYGNPEWPRRRGDEFLKTARKGANRERRVGLSDDEREHLQDLGYIS